MKTNPKSTAGNVLFTTLLTTGILSVFVGGYLTLVRSENNFTFRSQTWNAAIPIAEAGVEEALTYLKKSKLDAVNGWEYKKEKYYYKEYAFNADEYYKVGIFPPGKPNEATPVIVSQGFSRVPGKTNFISRTVRVNTKLDGPPMDGMIVLTTANMSGNKLSIDSFNSTNSAYSTDGRYDKTKRGDKVMLATLSTVDGAIDLGNADVWGKVGSAHTGVTPKLGANSSVGNLDWHNKNMTGLQPGAYVDDVNIAVIEPTYPFYSGTTPPTGSGNTYVLGSGEYAVDNLSKADLIVNGNASLLVTKTLDISSITIATNATLKLYVAAADANISGSPNVNGSAAKFKYYGLPADPSRNWTGNKTLSAGGNGEFTCMIYAPGTTLTLKGGGSTVSDLSGAVIAKNIIMTGHYNFHFDESIADAMADGYTPISWDELTMSWDTILANNYASGDLK